MTISCIHANVAHTLYDCMHEIVVVFHAHGYRMLVDEPCYIASRKDVPHFGIIYLHILMLYHHLLENVKVIFNTCLNCASFVTDSCTILYHL